MANADVIRPFVEKAVAALLEIPVVDTDSDGDIPVNRGSSVTFIRVFDGPRGPVIRFFSPLLTEVAKSPEMLERLNDLNAMTPFVNFCWANQQVFCSLDLAGEDVQVTEIANAMATVSLHADEHDESLQRAFGGRTMVQLEETVKPAIGFQPESRR